MSGYSRNNRERTKRSSSPDISRRRKIPVKALLKKRLTKLAKSFMRSPLVPIIAGIILLVIATVWIFWAVTNKNAYEVFVNEDSIGFTAINKKSPLTENDLYNSVESRLMQEADSNVQINEKITMKIVHTNKKAMKNVDYILEEIHKKLTYKVEAAVIKVNGVEMGIVKNASAAKNIENNIIDAYVQEGQEIVEKSIEEDFVIESKYVEKDDIVSDDRVYAKLTAMSDVEEVYTVKGGDNLWKICNSNGISEQEVLELNPEINPSKLKVGQEIRLTVSKPLLSVRTAEKVVYTDVAKKTVERRQDATKPKSYQRVVQQGKDGQREVTAHIIRINGAEVEQKSISEEITVQPVTEIIEVGTK